jgi:hypothetical protein
MRALLLVLIIIALFFMAGCSTPIPASRQTFNLNEQVIFENGVYGFGASISHLDVQNKNLTVTVSITIENKGNVGITLAVFPALVDPVGEEYPGSEIFFSQIAPGRIVTQTGTISLPSGAYETLKQNAALHIRFQGSNPVPYEAYWAVDFTNLPK